MNQIWQHFWDTQLNVLQYWAFSFQSCCVQWYLCSWGWTVANNYSGERWQGRAIFIHFNKTYISLNVANQCNIYTSYTVYLRTLISYFCIFWLFIKCPLLDIITTIKISTTILHVYNHHQYLITEEISDCCWLHGE